MKYFSFHAVNWFLLIFVLGTILLWVVWTPGSSGLQPNQERPMLNWGSNEPDEPPTKTATTSDPGRKSSNQSSIQ